MKMFSARVLSALVVAGAATLAMCVGGAAQDDDADDLTAAIYAGSCADGIEREPRFDLGDVALPNADEDDTEIVGAGADSPVASGDASIEATFAEFGEGDYAVVVQTGRDLSDVLACGDVAGVAAGGQLAVALAYVDAAAATAGIVLFQELADDTAQPASTERTTETDTDTDTDTDPATETATSSRLRVDVYVVPR